MDPHCSGGPGPPATWPVWPGFQGLGCVSFSSGPPASQGPHLPGWWGSWLLHRLYNNYKGFSDFNVGERELPQARWLTKSRQIIQRTASRLALKPITPVGNKGTDVSNHLKKKKKKLAFVKVKVAQPSPALCNPVAHTVPGILQASILEWVAFPFSRGSSQPRAQSGVSCIAGGFFIS